MAVTKLWEIHGRLSDVIDYATNPEKTTKSKSKYSNADYQALRDVLAYAKDEEKTERELFCDAEPFPKKQTVKSLKKQTK